jgi:hypothetical protein
VSVGGADRLTAGRREVGEGQPSIAWTRGRLERAARLYGACAVMRKGSYVLYVWDDRVARDRRIAAVRVALGDEAFTATWAGGQAMTLEEAITLALEDGARG